MWVKSQQQEDAMEMSLTAELAPIAWGLIALMLVVAGAVLAGVDPEIVEIYLGNPRWWVASAGIAVAAVVTIVASRPEIGHSLRALLAN